MSEIAKRVELLREQMKAHQVDAYIVPTSDFHETEYVCDYFKARAYMSGFTGSAGTCVLTAKEGKLWTDGRYFIQAAKQLEGSGIDLMRMGDEGVPTIEEYLLDALPEHAVLGFDGRVMNTAMVAGKRAAGARSEDQLRYGSCRRDLDDTSGVPGHTDI